MTLTFHKSLPVFTTMSHHRSVSLGFFPVLAAALLLCGTSPDTAFPPSVVFVLLRGKQTRGSALTWVCQVQHMAKVVNRRSVTRQANNLHMILHRARGNLLPPFRKRHMMDMSWRLAARKDHGIIRPRKEPDNSHPSELRPARSLWRSSRFLGFG